MEKNIILGPGARRLNPWHAENLACIYSLSGIVCPDQMAFSAASCLLTKPSDQADLDPLWTTVFQRKINPGSA